MSMEEIIGKFPSAAQMDTLNHTMLRIGEKLGAMEPPETWAEVQGLLRAGFLGQYLAPGDTVKVDRSETVSASFVGASITAVSVDKDTFLAAAGSHDTDYEFVYDGLAWHHDGAVVNLADYGITVTGTAAENDEILVHRSATGNVFDVMGLNEEVPVDVRFQNALTIMSRKCLGSRNFDPPQFLFAVTAAACTAFGWPNTGMPAGKYKVTLDHGGYGSSTGQDATYVFTTTAIVPVGGGVRHGVMGEYQKNKSDVLAGKFVTYGSDKVTTVETDLATTEYNAETDTDAVSLGTATAQNPTYKSGDYINFTERQRYGSNRWKTSWIRQYLNSDDATLNWKAATIWSRPISDSIEGFLHTLDPELRAVLGKVRKRYALQTADGGGYEDVEDIVTLGTLLDVFGQTNNSVKEGSVDAGGNLVRKTAYSYWKAHNTNAARVKLSGSSAASWWLASMHPDYADYVRNVDTSGALSGDGALDSRGVVPSLHII